MKAFSQMNNNELCELKKELEKRYLDFKARDLKLDMSRGLQIAGLALVFGLMIFVTFNDISRIFG